MKRKRKIYGVVAAAVADGDISLNNALTHICNESPNTVVPRLPVRVNDAVNNIQNTGQEVMIQEHENDISDIDVDINDCDEASISPVLRTISEREFFMAMVGKYLFLKYSNNRIKKEISIDNLLERPTITFNEYNKYVNDINSRYRVRKFYMCPSCWRLLPKVKNCICGMRFKRGKESTPILIQTASIRQQLTDAIRKNIEELSAPFIDSCSRKELSNYPQNKQQTEGDKRILKLMINTDGVAPKQNFRGDLWPVYLSLADLTCKSRGSITNCFISSLICGISKPTDPVWNVALKPLKAEIIELRERPIEVNGLKFSFEIDHGIFDNEYINASSPPPVVVPPNNGFAPPHVINDIYQRIYTIDNKVDSMMNKFQADSSALQASFTRLDTLVTQMKSQIDILSGIYSNQNGDELVADKYVFDPINITVERSEFDAVAKFYNGSNETINIYDCAALTKYFHRTNHEDLPRDLYTSILTEIYGEDNIHHYSAAKNSEFTSCFNLLDPITNFIAKGYCTATLTDIEVQFIRSWIKKSISSVNTWFFTNSRRNKKKAEEKEAQVEHRTPVRKRGREEINRTSSKKRRDDRIPRRHRIISIESD